MDDAEEWIKGRDETSFVVTDATALWLKLRGDEKVLWSEDDRTSQRERKALAAKLKTMENYREAKLDTMENNYEAKMKTMEKTTSARHPRAVERRCPSRILWRG